MKTKSNLLAELRKLFRKPPKPSKLEIMLMSKLQDLIAQVKLLVMKLTDARAIIKDRDEEIVSLKSALLAKDIQAEKDEAEIAALLSVINGVLDEGGSTGGVVG